MSLSQIALPIALAILKVASVAALGYLLARRGVLHQSATFDISNLVIKVIVPCLVFVNAAGGAMGMSGWVAAAVIAAGPLVLGAGYAVSSVLAKLLRVDPAYRKAVVAASTFQNSQYLPLAVASTVAPLVVSGIGGRTALDAGTNAIVCISLFGVIYSPVFWGFGLSWIAGGANRRFSVRDFMERLLPPPVIGLICGYVVAFTPLRTISAPHGAPLHFLFEAAADVGAMTVPLANLILGAMLARAGSGSGEPLRNHAIVLCTRFLIVPALFLAMLCVMKPWWVSSTLSTAAAFVIFLESVTPPATNLAVMSSSHNLDPTDRTAEAVPRLLLVAYPISIVVVPAWLLVFLHAIQAR